MARTLEERIGAAAGVAMAPVTGAVSALRRARTFHPRGTVWWGDVERVPTVEPWEELGERLEGAAIVRLSSAWWKRREWKDVLGCAIRFTHARQPTVEPGAGDQDLLLATVRRPWTLPFAPLATDPHDFLANRYYGVSPFRAPGIARFEWRLTPEQSGPDGRLDRDRLERLRRAVMTGGARFLLEARTLRALRATFQPVVRLRLTAPLDIDQEALRFDPFLTGREVEPVGFVHALRRATYAASQAARPSHGAVSRSGLDVEPTARRSGTPKVAARAE